MSETADRENAAPLDVLEQCTWILALLAEATPAMAGLSDKAASGLGLLLEQVERELRQARAAL